MTKQQKIKYIEDINNRFINARNHGSSGSNWWYPKENRIAYNVKVYGGINIEDIRGKLSQRQNEFYQDDHIHDAINDFLSQAANDLSEEVEMMTGVKDSGYAGRSGGWLEVDYDNPLNSYLGVEISELPNDDLNELYKLAKELEKNELAVSEYIKKRHKSFYKYIEGSEAVDDVINNLYSDEDIAEYYKDKIKNLTDKLK